MKKSQMLKDAVRALSLANLCFIIMWTELLAPGKSFWPEMPRLYSVNAFLALILDCLLLGSFFFLAISLARRSSKPWALKIAKLAFPLALLLPLNGFIRLLLPEQTGFITLMMLLLAVAVIALSDIAPWDRLIVRTSASAALVLSPFVIMTFTQAFWSMTKFSNKPLVPAVRREVSGSRVLWLLFDEMDQRVAISRRPERLELPELDRLRGEAISASNAYPPADATLLSMPALITGRLISEVRPVNPSELAITFADTQKAVRLSDQPNLFSEALKFGANTAIIGNYFPYCRILENSLTYCRHHDIAAVTLGQSMFNSAVSLIDAVPLGPILASFFPVFNDAKAWERNERQRQLDAYVGILKDAKEASVDPTLDLILVHWPVPHPPNIYDRREKRFVLEGASSYLDSLQLCDEALGELRAVLEKAGLWDKTAVLVSSDHWWRTDVWRPTVFWSDEDEKAMPATNDHRIPFVLKLAGQTRGVEYESEFNSILTHDLILALLRGELSGPDSVVQWLDEHRSIGESPYRLRE